MHASDINFEGKAFICLNFSIWLLLWMNNELMVMNSDCFKHWNQHWRWRVWGVKCIFVKTVAGLFDLLLVIDCMMSTLCHVSTLKMIHTSNHSHTFIFNFHLVLCEEEVIVRINQCMTGQQEQMQGVTMSEIFFN